MSGRGKAISIVLVLAVLGAATAVYFINDSRAKDA